MGDTNFTIPADDLAPHVKRPGTALGEKPEAGTELTTKHVDFNVLWFLLQEIVNKDGSPKTQTFTIPTLAHPSIYHEVRWQFYLNFIIFD